ncbi:hypothetical protein COY27_01575 [Candidatus Woesearchaeota archaeon CG_4_10_14_0_2_um_filter_33_13]|nr:MAG: hypothetical protein COY27_01575 [Candidatus Woesearchaeota archaeon CG_4_10_14_0_2_um_filter_33_13]
MERQDFKEMTKGWFVGDFEPSALKTDKAEVAVKRYKKDDFEEKHHHKVATEITLIISGKVEMNNQCYQTNDIIIILPGESTNFKVLEDTITVVVKVPCVKGDKYLGDAK